MAKNWISKLSPKFPMKTLKIEKNSISNLIKSLLNIYIEYCQKLDFEAFLQYSNEHLNNNNIYI